MATVYGTKGLWPLTSLDERINCCHRRDDANWHFLVQPTNGATAGTNWVINPGGYSKCAYYGVCHDFPTHTVEDWARDNPPLGFHNADELEAANVES